MEGSREEVMRFMVQVIAEFQIPDERTQAAKMQDWAVNLAWGGADELAASGMMNIMRREGGRQVDTGTYDDEKRERLRLLGQALQRSMRRRVDQCELQTIHSRAPAPELYWAVIASMIDDGTVNANVMRRDAPDPRTLELVRKEQQSRCDPFWLAKLRAGPLWLSNDTAPKPGEPLSVPMVDVHTGLPMSATLDILRHLWFRGPDCVASPHFVVWRHPDAIANTVTYLQKHVKTALIKITIYSAIASGRVRTSRGAIPSDKVLRKLCHGNTGDKKVGGLSLAQFDVLRAYRDGWEWSPFMPEVEDSSKTPTTSRYRVPMPLQATSWEEPMWIVRVVYTSTERDMISMEFIVGFEHPRGTTLYYDEVLWRIMELAGLDPDEWIMKNQSNDFGGVMYKKSAEFALRSKGLRRHGAPLRDCGTLHDDEQEIDECCLYWPPEKLFNGRHQKTCMSSRDHKCKKAEQYHYVAPNVYLAAYVAEFHSLDQVSLTRGVVMDVCAGSQSATHAMEMMGVSAIPMDERTHVDTGWGTVHNEHVELNAGFAHDPGTSAYDQFREVCHAKGVAMGRTNAVYVSIDCKPNIMNAQAKGLYRDKKGRPLPGADGDLARACDDQLLDFLRAVKRMDDERKTLIELRNREHDLELDAAYDASTDDEEK